MSKKAKLKILFASANPANDLNLDNEHREIQKTIEASPYSQFIEITTRLACEYNDLIDAMNREKPDIIHFSGHGMGEDGLVFSSPHSDTTITINKDTLQEKQIGVQKVSGEILQDIFATANDNLKLIVLNACLSQTQAEFIVKEIDFVIGMNNTIKDTTATIFAKRFYQSLASDVSIKRSFAQAKTQVKLEAPNETQTPVMFVKNENADMHISDIVDKSLSSGGTKITQTHTGSGDNVAGNKVVNNNGISIGGSNSGAVVSGNGHTVTVNNTERKIDAKNYFEKIDSSGTINFTSYHNEEIDYPQKIQEELNKLTVGNMIFNTPREMFFDESKVVTLRISKNDILTNDLTESEMIQEKIKISPKIKATLLSSDFDIISLNEEEQVVGNIETTEWKWSITSKLPKAQSNIYLRVSVVLILSENREEKKDIPVVERNIKIALR